MIPSEILAKLRPHQHAPSRALIDIFSQSNAAVDLSDCGTGKTFVACAVAATLKVPTLVICPKIAVTQWHQAAAHFNDTISAVGYELLRTGGTPFGTWEHRPSGDEAREYWVCQCCQLRVSLENMVPCYCHSRGLHCLVRKKSSFNYGRFTFHPAIETVIFDEVQRCGGGDSLNGKMLIAAKRQGLRILGLSATLASTPLHMKAIGYALGLFPHPRDFPRWARKYGVRYDASFYGLHWFAGADKQAGVMSAIRDEIIPSRGVRVAIKDIPDFPEVDISAELFDLDEADKITAIYAEMVDAIAALDKRIALDTETPLTIMLRAQQRVELLKIPIAVELAKGYVEKGFSIGVFCNFRQTMNELRRRLNTNCIIDGSDEGVRFRQPNIESFQSHESRVILINAAAGGVALSLPDLDGNHPRGGLVFPGYNATILKQEFGRFPRESSKSKSFYKVILAARTGDIAIHRALRAKLNNIDSLNDSDLLPENLRLTTAAR